MSICLECKRVYILSMNLPIILVNFKVYANAVGDAAVKLAKIHEKVAKDTGANIAIAVNALDLKAVCDAVSIPVFAQHVDNLEYGSGTGGIVPSLAKELGAYGTLLNHAERPVDDLELIDSIRKAKEVSLFVIVCANTPERAKEILPYGPDLLAIEPPELIGGDISVSKSEAAIIKKAVDYIGAGKVLVGAGVKDAEDVSLALEFGASGVLLASGVTKASDPEAVLRDLVSGLN